MRERDHKSSRIGPWRLLDLVQATMSLRAVTLGATVLPEFGPPDAIARASDPEELPESNIPEREQQQAVERERARRFVASRQPQRGL